MKQARDEWPSILADFKPVDLVFIDETWTTTDMARTHGYAPIGERLHATVPQGHWKVVTFVAGLTVNGFVAPWALDRGMNGEWFVAYVEQVLVPVLRPGQVVVMDNLSSHLVAGVATAIAAAQAHLLYLPPYSPDLNPIENAFSKLKSLLRKAAARTVDGLYAAMRQALTKFTTSDCVNFFKHCGYTTATPTANPL